MTFAIKIVLGPKILILMEVSKSFGTHITEEPHRHLVRIVFWLGMGSNGPKITIFGQRCQFKAKFGRFWAKTPFLGGWSKTFGILISGNQ